MPELDNFSISNIVNSDSNDESDDSIDDDTSSSNSIDDSSDTGDYDGEDVFIIHSGEEKLYISTTLTVREFSIDILEFYRSSRLPNTQRHQLLQLFKKYLPSPNLVPQSSECLSSKSLF